MSYQYGPFDGEPFRSPDDLFPKPQILEFIMQHGEDALDALQQLQDAGDDEDFLQQLIDAGLLEWVEDEEGGKGKLQLTPKMLKGLQHRALLEIFADLRKGAKEGHPTPEAGRSGERTEGTKPYEFGDPLSELDLGTTMRNAVARQPGGPKLPVKLSMNDFELHVTEGQADCATVILIDQSGSMMRWGRFHQAKRVALGMAELINQRFPQDSLDYVGFYSLAERIEPRQLPLVMPKPVSIHDYQVRIRVPLTQAREQQERLPLHFTNLQLGLRQARQILARKGAANKQIFIITDGQPTAHVQRNDATGQEMLYLLYPPHPDTADITLKEAIRCQQAGIRIASFALIEDYWGMDWVGFIDKLTRLTRGTAYYCTSEDLSSTVLESYVSGKKRKSFIH